MVVVIFILVYWVLILNRDVLIAEGRRYKNTSNPELNVKNCNGLGGRCVQMLLHVVIEHIVQLKEDVFQIKKLTK
jgi:hypothetical protein